MPAHGLNHRQVRDRPSLGRLATGRPTDHLIALAEFDGQHNDVVNQLRIHSLEDDDRLRWRHRANDDASIATHDRGQRRECEQRMTSRIGEQGIIALLGREFVERTNARFPGSAISQFLRECQSSTRDGRECEWSENKAARDGVSHGRHHALRRVCVCACQS